MIENNYVLQEMAFGSHGDNSAGISCVLMTKWAWLEYELWISHFLTVRLREF